MTRRQGRPGSALARITTAGLTVLAVAACSSDPSDVAPAASTASSDRTGTSDTSRDGTTASVAGTNGTADTSASTSDGASTTTAVSVATTAGGGPSTGAPVDTTAGGAATAPTDPPATTTPVRTEPVLRTDGIGDVSFGAAPDSVLASLAPFVGASILDESTQYTLGDDGRYEDADGFTFPHEFGRQACFANGLCLTFGGDEATTTTWLGWSYSPGRPIEPFLATSAGVAPGARWADLLAAIEVFPDGCFGIGFGTTEGIDLELVAESSWFGTMGVESPPVPTEPDPATVVITSMRSGARPVSTEGDC